jgi:hypothetical protein
MVYFDCRDGDDGDDFVLSDTLPCQYDASWWHFSRQVFWSLIIYVAMYLFCVVYEARWEKIVDHQYWAKEWVGSLTKKPKKGLLEATLRVAQLVASIILMACWVWKSYEKRVTNFVYGLEASACVVCIIHLIFALIRNGYAPSYVLGIEGFIDVFTIVPVLLQLAPGGMWLTISYLRTYRIKTAFYRLCDNGTLEPYMGEFAQALVKNFVDFVACVSTIACTMYIFEGLGDVRFFQDNFIPSGMGSISFFQLCYFAMTTMTTVGYGDYSPTTVFNRLFFFVASIGGVTFFSIVTAELLDLTSKLSSGMGKFRPKYKRGSTKNPRGHILVLGGAVSSPSKACLESFLQGLCRDSNTPEVVLLATECQPEVREMLQEPWIKSKSIQFFKGDATSNKALRRVRAEEASMTFIISDFFSSSPYSEDHNNVLLAAALQAYSPSAQYRLITIELRHLPICDHIGLEMFNCYAMDGMKAATLASALRCPGLPTLVMNMGLPDISRPEPYDPPISPWLDEYISGAELEPYGFLPAAKFVGTPYKNVALEIAKNADVVLLAAQINGQIVLNPGKFSVTAKTVLFALAKDQEFLDPFALEGDASVRTWLPQFQANRDGSSIEPSASDDEDHDDDTEFEPTYRRASSVRRVLSKGPVKRLTMPGKPFSPRSKMKVTSASKMSTHTAIAPQTDYDDLDDALVCHEGAPPDELLKKGGHVVVALVVQSADVDSFVGLWQQVELIFKILREFSDEPMVVISALGLAELSPVKKLINRIREAHLTEAGDHTLFLVEGDPLKPHVMLKAGADTAGHYMTLSPSTPHGTGLMDRNNLLAQMVLDEKLNEWKRRDLTPVYDWYATDAFRLMRDALRRDLDDPPLTDGDKKLATTERRVHHRYAAGLILPKPLIAGVLSMAYYTPGKHLERKKERKKERRKEGKEEKKKKTRQANHLFHISMFY